MGRLRWAVNSVALKCGDGIWPQRVGLMLSIPILLALLIIVLVLLVAVVRYAIPELFSLSIQLISITATLGWFWLKQMLKVILLTAVAISLTLLMFVRLAQFRVVQAQLYEPDDTRLAHDSRINQDEERQ